MTSVGGVSRSRPARGVRQARMDRSLVSSVKI